MPTYSSTLNDNLSKSHEPKGFSRSPQKEFRAKIAASKSYGWLASAISFYVQEICILMRIVTGQTKMERVNYERVTICEVETNVVAGLLRIVVNYLKQFEKLFEQRLSESNRRDPKNFKLQQACMKLTLTAILNELCPRLISFIENVFSGEHLKDIFGVFPAAVVGTIVKKVSQMMERIQGE